MGIQRIESVIYSVDDLATCVRFFTDLGLTPIEKQDERAVFETLIGQTLHLRTGGATEGLPPSVEPGGNTIREVVWGAGTSEDVAGFVAALVADREVTQDADGVYCRISHDGRPAWGVVEGDVIRLLDASPLAGGRPDGRVEKTEMSVFLPPVIPPVFYAVGLNYRGHVEHAKETGYRAAELPDRPEVGYRANNALTGHGSPIIRPAGVEGRFEAEPEVVAVIGRTLRNASRSEARESVLGWTIGNDVSAREWQNADRTFWRSKNADTFKPMGPWIETDVDPLAQTTTVRVDGDVRARFATGAMIFDPYDYIVETTKYITMHPGDVLWMGADATVPLEPGTVVDIEISGIGVLSNPVLAED